MVGQPYNIRGKIFNENIIYKFIEIRLLRYDKLSLQANSQMAENRILFLENELKNLNKFDKQCMTIL